MDFEICLECVGTYGRIYQRIRGLLSHTLTVCGLACTCNHPPETRCWPGLRRRIFSQRNMSLFLSFAGSFLPLPWAKIFPFSHSMLRVLTFSFPKCCLFRSHWNLLIFCHFGESEQSETHKPCMLLLDSLENADPRRYEPDIRKYDFL